MSDFTYKNYGLRNASILKRKINFAVHFGSESPLSLASKIWELEPDSTKEGKTLSTFKNRVKV